MPTTIFVAKSVSGALEGHCGNEYPINPCLALLRNHGSDGFHFLLIGVQDLLRAGYSYLSATMGSTFVARRAGMKQAAIATMTSSAPTATIVTGSSARTS